MNVELTKNQLNSKIRKRELIALTDHTNNQTLFIQIEDKKVEDIKKLVTFEGTGELTLNDTNAINAMYYREGKQRKAYIFIFSIELLNELQKYRAPIAQIIKYRDTGEFIANYSIYYLKGHGYLELISEDKTYITYGYKSSLEYILYATDDFYFVNFGIKDDNEMGGIARTSFYNRFQDLWNTWDMCNIHKNDRNYVKNMTELFTKVVGATNIKKIRKLKTEDFSYRVKYKDIEITRYNQSDFKYVYILEFIQNTWDNKHKIHLFLLLDGFKTITVDKRFEDPNIHIQSISITENGI